MLFIPSSNKTLYNAPQELVIQKSTKKEDGKAEKYFFKEKGKSRKDEMKEAYKRIYKARYKALYKS